VARKFNFYAWLSGKSSAAKKTADLRRFGILVLCVITLVGAGIFLRRIFWSGAGDNAEHHAHEKGPHGGIVVAIHHGEPHYHAEFVVEDDGRVNLFTYGSETDQILKLKAQKLIARVKTSGKDAASLILRPIDSASVDTEQFVGRMAPYLVGEKVSIAISHIEIANRQYSFQFELLNQPSTADKAVEFEKKLLLTPGGTYTQADIDANGRTAAFEKFRSIMVVHSLQVAAEDRLCPVTQARANPRIAWVVGGKSYEFCCPACISDFVAAAKQEFVVP